MGEDEYIELTANEGPLEQQTIEVDTENNNEINITRESIIYTNIPEERIEDIENRITTAEGEIDDIQAEQTEQNTNIQTNADDIEILQNKVDMLEGIIDTDTETGEEITLTNSARYYFKEFEVQGNTEQQSYTGKNLIDVSKIEQGGMSGATDSYGTDYPSSTRVRTEYIEVEPASTYFIKVFDSNKIIPYLFEYDENKTANETEFPYHRDINNNSYSFTTTSATKYVRIAISKANSNNIIPSEVLKVQLEEGSTATDYEPYVGGTASPSPLFPQPIENVSGEVEVKVENKNLNDGSIVRLGYYNANGTFANNNTFRANVMKVSPNTRYALSTTLSQGFYNTMVLLDKNRNLISTISYLNKNGAIVEKGYNNDYFKYAIFTTPANCYYVSAGLLASTDEEYNNQVMLEPVEASATTPTAYEPHEEQTATLHLPEGMEMCKIGDYKDSFVYQGGKWYKNKIIGKVVLDGTENWILNSNYEGRYRYTLEINDIIYYSVNTGTDISAISDRFLGVQTAQWSSTINSITVISNRRLLIASELTSLTAFKALLQEKNAIAYYVLATPVLEEITDTTLISDLESLKNIYSYKGTTYISSSNEISPVFNVEYRKDPSVLESRLDALEATVALLE